MEPVVPNESDSPPLNFSMGMTADSDSSFSAANAFSAFEEGCQERNLET
jgi:hypothetical protein